MLLGAVAGTIEGTIVRATLADAPALAAFRLDFIRAVKDLSAAQAALVLADARAMFEAELNSGRMIAWLFRRKDRPVASCALRSAAPFAPDAASVAKVAAPFAPDAAACASLRPPCCELPPARRAELLAVYTIPDARRQGIAGALVTEALAEARRRSVVAIYLQPTSDSRALYKAAGFRDIRRGHMLLHLC